MGKHAIQNYLLYLKDNPKGYWFKHKLYGWGWVPVTWQGWSITGIFIAYILYLGLQLEQLGESYLQGFFIRLLLAVLLLVWICYRTGEKPRWSWGLSKK